MKKMLRAAALCALCCVLLAATALAQDSIVGSWSGKGTAMGMIPVNAKASFLADKTFTMELEVMDTAPKFAGQYELEGENLRLNIPAMDPVLMTCKITGNSMKLIGRLDFGAFDDVSFDVTLTKSDGPTPTPTPTPTPATSVVIDVTVKDNALVKAGDVYEAVQGASLPALTWHAEGDGANLKASWKSSKSKFLSITAKGAIKAKKAGLTTVTLTAKRDKKTSYQDSVALRVVSAAIKQKKATVYVDGTTAKKPNTVQLTAIILPADASDTAKALTWKSDKPDIASVDENGVVKAVSAGKAVITLANGYGQTAVCKVTVK